MKTNFLFMAFSTGKESVEGGEFKRFIGVAPVKIIAVNPNKAELEKIYNTTLEKDVEYVTKKDDVISARIDFIVATDEEKCGVNLVSKMSFFVRKKFRFNGNGDKVQVIDKYGRTAWVTKEQCNRHEIPQYANGPANIDKDYRPCYLGEESLTNFIKTYLNIPNVQKYVDNKWILVDHPEECEARLEHIEDYFNNNFKELKEIISYQPNNKVKVMFGVKTTDDGKQYQTIYADMVLRNNVKDYTKLANDIKDRKAAGAYQTTDFDVCDLKEYVVTPTSFDSKDDDDLPMSNDNWFNN